MSGDVVRLTAWVHGYVQGVGFRWWVYGQANELGLSGSATNLNDGVRHRRGAAGCLRNPAAPVEDSRCGAVVSPAGECAVGD